MLIFAFFLIAGRRYCDLVRFWNYPFPFNIIPIENNYFGENTIIK